MKKEKTILERIESLEAGLLELKGWLLLKEFSADKTADEPKKIQVRFVEVKDKAEIKKLMKSGELLEATLINKEKK